MDRDNIALGDQRRKRLINAAGLFGERPIRMRVERDDAHGEPLCDARDIFPDMARAHDAERFSGEIESFVIFHIGRSVAAQAVVGRVCLARKRQHQCECVFGDRSRAVDGDVGHGDVLRSRRRKIDMVVAGRARGYTAELRQDVQDFLRKRRGDEYRKHLGVGHRRERLRRDRPFEKNELMAREFTLQ